MRARRSCRRERKADRSLQSEAPAWSNELAGRGQAYFQQGLLLLCPEFTVPRVHCAQVRRVITKGYARSRYRIDRCGWAILVCRKIYPEQHQVNWRYVQTDDGSGT